MVTSSTSYVSSASSSSSDSEEEGAGAGEVLVVGEQQSLPDNNFKKVVAALKEEEMVASSSKGPHIVELLSALLASKTCTEIDRFNDAIGRNIQSCLSIRKGKIYMAKLWRNFHMFRISAPAKAMWEAFVGGLNLSNEVMAVSDLTLQLILKRLMQSTIQDLTIVTKHTQVEEQPSFKERNIVRYIAGYVVFTLKKRHPQYEAFFDAMVSTTFHYIGQPGRDEYNIWMEQIDRGGLCKISDSFFDFILQIELICEKYLHPQMPQSDELSETIYQEVLSSPTMTAMWSDIDPTSLPSDNDKIRVLKYIIQLWLNVRIHSFTKQWSNLLHLNAAAKLGQEKALRKDMKTYAKKE